MHKYPVKWMYIIVINLQDFISKSLYGPHLSLRQVSLIWTSNWFVILNIMIIYLFFGVLSIVEKLLKKNACTKWAKGKLFASSGWYMGREYYYYKINMNKYHRINSSNRFLDKHSFQFCSFTFLPFIWKKCFLILIFILK